MTKRGKKKAEKLKRGAIHRMLDLALDINGMQASQRKLTGDRPTAFFYMAGHVGRVEVDVHPHGWEPDEGCDKGLPAGTNLDNRPFIGEPTLSGAVRKLEKTKFELMNGRISDGRI